MTVAVVTGTRRPSAKLRVILELLLFGELEGIDHVLVGDADGVDAMTRRICEERKIACEVFTAEWDRLGTSAGPARNERMVKRAVELRAEGQLVVGFAVPDQRSKGTWHCTRVLAREGFGVRVYPVPEGSR